jgi:hypothetical protein
MFMRVNSKCAHQVRPPLGRKIALRTERCVRHAVVMGYEQEAWRSL